MPGVNVVGTRVSGIESDINHRGRDSRAIRPQALRSERIIVARGDALVDAAKEVGRRKLLSSPATTKRWPRTIEVMAAFRPDVGAFVEDMTAKIVSRGSSSLTDKGLAGSWARGSALHGTFL